jgi:ABC-2 type transport system permease protein
MYSLSSREKLCVNQKETNDMKKFITDVFLLVSSESLIHVREPVWVFVGIFEPLVYLLLFAPFLKGVSSAPGFPSETVIQFFAPGMLVMITLFGTAFVGFGLLDKLNSGVLERLRVTPISRLALALGYLLENALVLMIQCIFLLLFSVLMGLNLHVSGLILLFVLIFLIGVVMASFSCALAILVKDGSVLASTVNFVILPLYLLSGIMLPLKFAPGIIQTIAMFNPFSYAVYASRALVEGSLTDSSVIIAFAIFVILAFITLYWFIRIIQDTVS